MDNQIRAALATGDLDSVILAGKPDESYQLSMNATDGVIKGGFYRFGSTFYATTVDTRPDQQEVKAAWFGAEHSDDCSDPAACASEVMARMVQQLRSAHAMARDIVPELSAMTCEHRVADDMVLTGTPFEDTVIPDGMDRTV